MVLVFGGAYNGKLDFVKETFNINKDDIFYCGEDEIDFSPEAKEELLTLSEMVLKASGRALEALEKNDKEIAAEAVELCRDVKRFQKEIRKNHIVRLNEKRCDPVAGFIMLELLINMKRVADHSKNISQLVQGTF